MPDDFALRLEFGCGDRDTIDTFDGAYRRAFPAQSTRITIPPELKRELFSAVHEARVFELPARVTGMVCEPMILTTLAVQANGVRHTTTWGDCSQAALDPNFPFKLDPEKVEVRRRLYCLESLVLGVFKNQIGVRKLRSSHTVCL